MLVKLVGPKLLLELSHRNFYGALLPSLGLLFESKKNLVRAKELYERLFNLGPAEMQRLTLWLGMSEEQYTRAVRRQHISLIETFIQYYDHSGESAFKASNLKLQLKYILKYNLLDSMYMQWIMHATDAAMTLTLPHLASFKEAYYLLRAAQVVFNKYNEQARKAYLSTEVDGILATIKFVMVQHLCQLIFASKFHLEDGSLAVWRINREPVAEFTELDVPEGIHFFEELLLNRTELKKTFKYARALNDEAKALAMKNDPLIDKMTQGLNLVVVAINFIEEDENAEHIYF